jgi:hypothetical protein
LVHTSAFDIL